MQAAPEIAEMDVNPLLASGDKIVAVDARINIQKNNFLAPTRFQFNFVTL